MIGLTGGSVFKGIFGSKEGQEFLNSDEGLEFVSKLALNDDEEEVSSHLELSTDASLKLWSSPSDSLLFLVSYS